MYFVDMSYSPSYLQHIADWYIQYLFLYPLVNVNIWAYVLLSLPWMSVEG